MHHSGPNRAVDVSLLGTAGPPVRFHPGQMIYLQDAPATQFYYVLRGKVKVFVSSPNGDERILTIHGPGDLMGEAAFFDGLPRMTSAMAVTLCEAVPLDRGTLSPLLTQHPDLTFAIFRYLSRTIRLLSGQVEAEAFLSADRRLARHLLTRSGGAPGPIPCTHQELGDAIGASRVTVSRILAVWVEAGYVETGYGSLVLRRPALLRAKAEGARCDLP